MSPSRSGTKTTDHQPNINKLLAINESEKAREMNETNKTHRLRVENDVLLPWGISFALYHTAYYQLRSRPSLVAPLCLELGMMRYLFLLANAATVFGFSLLRYSSPVHPTRRCASQSNHPTTLNRRISNSLLFAFYNDFDELGDGQDDIIDSSSDDIYAALRQRQSTLKSYRQRDMQAWKVPPVETMAFPLLNDWVRRVAMDTTAVGVTATSSYAIVGGASGSLYLIDLSAEAESPEEVEENMMLGTLYKVHEDRGEDDFPDVSSDTVRSRALDALYNGFDGGGIIALAMQNNIVASAGREGGIHISRISEDTDKLADGGKKKRLLKGVGKIPDLKDFITSLAFDQTGMLWTGSYSGRQGSEIRAFDVDESDAKRLNPKPKYTIPADSGILSLFLADDIGCGVVATKRDGVLLFSIADGTLLDKWDPFHKDIDEEEDGSIDAQTEFARSAIILQNDETSEDSDATWSVVIGGSKGNMYQRKLMVADDGKISSKRPFDGTGQKVPETVQVATLTETVKHEGPIVALASPGPQVLLSAGQDGTIRIWDCSYQQKNLDDDDNDNLQDENGRTQPNFLFALSGFKVWLGSMIVLKSNHNMLVTDGSDNTVVALIFRKADELDNEE